jgi:8-oxo-dGTP pyrophosphatase MutT (NUDIX family)
MTPNERIAALLTAHHPADDKEAADMATIRRMLPDAPNLMDRQHPPGHLTASALVIDARGAPDSGRFLLHHHRKLRRWLQFGGHIETGETDPLAAAIREAAEESGLGDLRPLVTRPLDIDVHPIPARADQPEHLHLDVRYALLTWTPDAVIAEANADHDPDVPPFAWLTMAEVAERGLSVDPALQRLIGKALALFAAEHERTGGRFA